MKVAIIGGSGKMGRWFARFLLEEGREVVITGRNEEKLRAAGEQLGVRVASNVEAVQGAEVVLIAVPIDSFEAVVKELAPHLTPEQMVIDITSIKVFPVETMHKYIKTGVVLGTHPVFGPGAKSLRNQNFVLTPAGEKETALAEKISKYLEERGAKVTLMTPREHDEMMAVILGLCHFIAIAAADTLLNFDLKEMKAIGGPTYKILLTLAESVVTEDAGLYASLQMNLPGIAEAEELFLKSSKSWAEIVKNQDKAQFIRKMKALKDRLERDDPDFGRSYESLYGLLDKP
ncbi:MAG: prephenate dehydrogenase [Dehalococcoidales bacterium]|nr:prephenate dehydrogenase [Dehalococcoidales bacterium]